MLDGKQNHRNTISTGMLEDDWLDQLPSSEYPGEGIDELPTLMNLRSINDRSYRNATLGPVYSWSIDEMDTWLLPAVSARPTKGEASSIHAATDIPIENHIVMLRRLVKSSGIYALSSLTAPLISLVLAPFLTHNLSLSDYGILTVINTAIGLVAGITQLGLPSAFFRAYGYDFTSELDRRAVVATTTTILFLISVPMAIFVVLMAPTLANLLFDMPSLGNYIALAGGIIVLQNLTVPGLAWLRAESRSLLYSLLSIGNLLVTLLANVFLVGVLHWGVPGVIIANGCGYACIAICTLPIIFLRAGIKIRVDIARNLLAFGLPLALGFVSYWVLQLSDRYLLSLFGSLTETAKYGVVYTLGSTMSVVVIGPFSLAWPTTMFAIAKRKDAAHIFKLIFRWFGMFLLFVAFGMSLVATFILYRLFPVTYHSAALVIPVVAESIVFYGIYFIFMVGANIKRKTWFIAVLTTIAAVVNLALNLVLIPHYGAIGAAASTLIAYLILALTAYIVNQLLYPIPFEIGRFIVALFVGMAFYLGSSFLTQGQTTYAAWGISLCALFLYGGCLAILIWLPAHHRKN